MGMDDQCMYLQSIYVDQSRMLWTRGHTSYMDCGCNGWNIRQVVAGARKWLYEARMGATGCYGSGVT